MKLTKIKLLQRCCKAALAVATVCFLSLGIQPLLFPNSLSNVALVGALANFFTALFLLGAIASVKCPSCTKPFIGSTVEDGVPTASLFTRECKYCGFPTQCLPSSEK